MIPQLGRGRNRLAAGRGLLPPTRCHPLRATGFPPAGAPRPGGRLVDRDAIAAVRVDELQWRGVGEVPLGGRTARLPWRSGHGRQDTPFYFRGGSFRLASGTVADVRSQKLA